MQKGSKKENKVHNKRKYRKKHKCFHKYVVLLCIAMFLLGVFCGKKVFAKDKAEAISQTEIMKIVENKTTENRININQGRIRQEKDVEQEWKLVLVNSNHFMEEGYIPKLAEIENNYYFDERAVADLQAMLKEGRAEGLDFLVCSAYRTMEKQTSLYENKVQRLMQEKGISYEKAYEKARYTVAYPGTSEHQLGLAVDLVARDYQQLDDKQADTDEAKWLKEHCHEYGFILRYPLDKIEETGIIFEPWHYRYVGKKAAKEIMEKGICLEEYLGMV